MSEDPKTASPVEDQPKTALYASKESPIVLRPHVYDGIQEYDQKLPNWWLFTFYIMIVLFVVFWAGYYQLGFFKSDHERVSAAMAAIEKKRDVLLEELLENLDDKVLVTEWASNDKALAAGEATYKTVCLACHGEDLAAVTRIPGMDPIPMPGRSLTDGEWTHGGRPMDIFNIIKNGSPPDSEGYNNAKMEAWGLKLPPRAIAEVTAYVISKNPEEFKKYAQ